MTPERIKEVRKKWKEENYDFGIDLGYPECCVNEFCDDAPEILKYKTVTKDDKRRYKAGCINGQFSGFIPCKQHAKQIVQGKITIHSLIKNRNAEFPPFPFL